MDRLASIVLRIVPHGRRLPALAALGLVAAAAAGCSTGGAASASGGAVAANPSSATVPLEGTGWQLIEYVASGGTSVKVPAGVTATATFSGGTVAGNAGCNDYTGPYTLDGTSLTIGALASTRKACPPPETAVETAFLSTMAKVGSYAISGSELALKSADGAIGLRFTVATGASLTKTAWLATGINNGKGGVQSVATNSTVTATFGDDGSITGSGGCNTYRGTYTVDGSKMTIGQVASTAMACADQAVSDQETAYFAGLGKVATFALTGDRLQLRSADGALQVDYRVQTP